MSYQLNDLILPNPRGLTRNIIEVAVEHLLMFGRTTKNYRNRKEQFILNYTYLTPEQIGSILSLYTLGNSLIFRANDDKLDIGPTDVLMDITGREYLPSGELYLENINIILMEVR